MPPDQPNTSIRTKESSDAAYGIWRPSRPAGTDRRRLGDHQHHPELRFQREKTALDAGGAVAAATGTDSVVFPRAEGRQGVGRAGIGLSTLTGAVAAIPRRLSIVKIRRAHFTDS